MLHMKNSFALLAAWEVVLIWGAIFSCGFVHIWCSSEYLGQEVSVCSTAPKKCVYSPSDNAAVAANDIRWDDNISLRHSLTVLGRTSDLLTIRKKAEYHSPL